MVIVLRHLVMEWFDLLGEASHLSPPPLALLRIYRDLDFVLGTLGEEGSQNKVVLTLFATLWVCRKERYTVHHCELSVWLSFPRAITSWRSTANGLVCGTQVVPRFADHPPSFHLGPVCAEKDACKRMQ